MVNLVIFQQNFYLWGVTSTWPHYRIGPADAILFSMLKILACKWIDLFKRKKNRGFVCYSDTFASMAGFLCNFDFQGMQ